MNTPFCIAHRGDRVNFSENTLAAFESAFEKGAAGVEMDLQLMNGSICIVHNYLLNSTDKYPTFESILQRIGQWGRLELEIKAYSNEILSPLAALLDQYQPKDIELTTSEIPLLPSIVKKFPNVNIGVIFNECTFKDWMSEEVIFAKTIGSMRLLGATVAHIATLPEKMLTASLVSGIQASGYKVHYHILKTEMSEQLRIYDRLKKLGVDQFTFDDIGLLANLPKTGSP